MTEPLAPTSQLSTEHIAELLKLARAADGRLEILESELQRSENLRRRAELWKWPVRAVSLCIGFVVSVVTNQIASTSWAVDAYRQGEHLTTGLFNDVRAIGGSALPWIWGGVGVALLLAFLWLIVQNFRRADKTRENKFEYSEDDNYRSVARAGFGEQKSSPAIRKSAPARPVGPFEAGVLQLIEQ